MKIIATKYEDIEVEVSEENIEVLMCDLLKEDWTAQLDVLDKTTLDAMALVYEMYSGKPIDYFGHLDG